MIPLKKLGLFMASRDARLLNTVPSTPLKCGVFSITYKDTGKKMTDSFQFQLYPYAAQLFDTFCSNFVTSMTQHWKVSKHDTVGSPQMCTSSKTQKDSGIKMTDSFMFHRNSICSPVVQSYLISLWHQWPNIEMQMMILVGPDGIKTICTSLNHKDIPSLAYIEIRRVICTWMIGILAKWLMDRCVQD